MTKEKEDDKGGDGNNPLDNAVNVLDGVVVIPEPGDESLDMDVDLENMTLWQHVEFWGTLIYQFVWQM